MKEIMPRKEATNSCDYQEYRLVNCRQMTMFTTRHGPFKRLLWKMNLSNDFKCRLFDSEQETAENILRDCIAPTRRFIWER